MKTLNRMVLNRIRPVLDALLRTTQNGFREKRTTVGQIIALRRIIEGVKNKNHPAVMTFIDFRRCSTPSHRGRMLDILRAYGIPEKLVKTVAASYSRTRARVITTDGTTELFDILAGVMQGDTLAPYLFIIVLDYALRRAIRGREEELGFTLVPRKSRRVPPVNIIDLGFADDIALLLYVEEECLKIGLHLNTGKTKVLAYNTTDAIVHTRDGTLLKTVSDFKYLGAYVDSSEKDLRTRRGLAWSALHKMKKVWTSGLSTGLKRSLFLSTIESVLLYGSETWTLTTKAEKSLDGCYTRMLRMALEVSWQDHVRNIDLYDGMPRVTDKIKEHRLKLAGHCVRHPELAACPTILWEPKQGTASRGRRRLTFVDQLKRDTGLTTAEEHAWWIGTAGGRGLGFWLVMSLLPRRPRHDDDDDSKP